MTSRLLPALHVLLPDEAEELLIAACVAQGEEAEVAWREFEDRVGNVKRYFEQNYAGLKGLLPFVESRLAANRIDAGKEFHTYGRVALVREELRVRIITEILVDLLISAGERSVRPTLLKGAAMAATVYPQPSVRHVHAIDLLIDPRDWHTMCEVLAIQRFKADPVGPDAAHHQNFTHWTGLALGLHTRAFYLPYFELPAAALKRTRSADIYGERVRVLSPEDNLVHVCGHAAYSRCRSNLRWACDAGWLISQNPNLDWALVIDTAEKSGTLPALSVQLNWLAQSVCTIPFTALADLAQRGRHLSTRHQEAYFAALMHSTLGRRRPWQALAGNRGEQLRFLSFSLMPSLQYMRWKHNSTSPLKLAMAYADRPRRFALRAAHLGGAS